MKAGPTTPDAAAPVPAHDPFNTRDAMLSWVRDIAPYGIFTTDADLVIRDWNQWLATHSGLSAAEVVGRRLADVFPDLARRHMGEHFQRALRGEIAVLSTALHRYLLPFPAPSREYDTEYMLQTARIAPLPAGEEIVGTVTIIEDVTQRECQAAILRRQQLYDRLLSEALALLLTAEDPVTAIAEVFPRIAAPLRLDVYLNFLVTDGAKQLRLHGAAGVAPEVRKTLATIPMDNSFCGRVAQRRAPLIASNVHLDDSPNAEFARRLGLQSYAGFPLLIGDRVLGTLSFGSYARATIAGDELEFLGKLTQYLAIALDRNQRDEALRQAQQRLSQHAGELEQKVAERTARLHETIVQLESFSYTIAHDLRAPIRSLTGFTDILIGEFGTAMPETAQDMLRRIQRASRRLDALTHDLLKFSRIIREDVTLAAVNLDELVEEIVAVTPALRADVLTVERPLGTVMAQRTLLQQCVSNFLDNALKFARPGVPVHIVLRTELRDDAAVDPARHGFTPPFQPVTKPAIVPLAPGPRLRVWIEDNGIGIPTHAHDKVWGVFERIPGPTLVEGTGIGLAIVARAVQQMGGACGVESEVGRGSRFWMEFAAV